MMLFLCSIMIEIIFILVNEIFFLGREEEVPSRGNCNQ
jgi:hypothetical protein